MTPGVPHIRVVRKRPRAFEFARNQPHPRYPAVPEIAPQPLDQVAGLMLEEDGCARIALQREHLAVRPFAEPYRLGDARDVRARNLAPAQHKGCVQEAGALECRRRVGQRVLASRPGAAAPRGRAFGRVAPFLGSLHPIWQQ